MAAVFSAINRHNVNIMYINLQYKTLNKIIVQIKTITTMNNEK